MKDRVTREKEVREMPLDKKVEQFEKSACTICGGQLLVDILKEIVGELKKKGGK